MAIYAMLELNIHGEAFLRAGEIPQLRFLRVSSTDMEIAEQLKELSSQMTYTDRGKEKPIVTIQDPGSDSFGCKIVDGFAHWVLWMLLNRACSEGWEPYAGHDTTHHLLRKMMAD